MWIFSAIRQGSNVLQKSIRHLLPDPIYTVISGSIDVAKIGKDSLSRFV